MSAYLLPIRYQGSGVGITVVIAGLQGMVFDSLSMSMDGFNFIDTPASTTNDDWSEPVTFEGLELYRYHTVFAKIITGEDDEINISANMTAQKVVTVRSVEELRQTYKGQTQGKFTPPQGVEC